MDTDSTQAAVAVAEAAAQAHWQVEYNFWHKLITEEVERLRWNQGFEPFEVELYPASKARKRYQPDFAGQTQIGRKSFHATAKWTVDAVGNKVLKLKVFPAQHSSDLTNWAYSSARLYNDNFKP